MYDAVSAPAENAAKHRKAIGHKARKSKCPLAANVMVAEAVPNKP